ncbi:triosephosphate isomerase [Deltaproteobacteria bacterium]|nr:triosephosphate isomerase [Deltaproteobacteria bacterium]
MRRKFIVGNWKMHKGPADADALADALKRALAGRDASVDVGVAPPYISLPAVVSRLKHTGILVAAQNLHTEQQGAFTGEVSGEMLRQAGVAYCLVGHSERRQLFGDTDAIVEKKVHACFRSGLLPILCVGELLAEREAGQEREVVTRQLAAALGKLQADQVPSVTLAYEPVWAIGTGKTASPLQAQEMHATIRGWLEERFPAFVARTTRIQYGGSVKGSNAAELMRMPDIDGALVGGASLNAEDFLAILDGCR